MVESRTKLRLTGAEVAALTERAFAGARAVAVEELTEGYFNTAYGVELDDGQALVLKIAPPQEVDVLTCEQQLMRAEVEVMRRVAPDPAVPVPVVRHADFTRQHLPADLFFMDLVGGTPWSALREGLSVRQNAEIERQVGAITARINRVTGSAFGYPAVGPRFERWADAFGWMCRTLYEDARRFGIEPSLPPDEMDDLLARHRAAFDEIVVARLVHWDLWAGNVFVRLDGDLPEVTGVIDFERALWADPLMEFIPGRLRDIEAYEAGYGRPLLATREARLRRLFYNAYLGLVLVIEDGPRQYADRSTVEWGRGLLDRAAAMLRHGDVIEGLTEYA